MCVNFLHVCCNLSYFTLTCPFRIRHRKSKNCFELVEWRLQKIACAVTQFLAMVMTMNSIQKAYTEMVLVHPTSVLFCLEVLMGFLYRLSVIISLWRNGHLMVRILNYLAQDPLLTPLQVKSRLTSKGFACCFMVVCLAITILRSVMHPFEFLKEKFENNGTLSLPTWYGNIRFGMKYSGGIATLLSDAIMQGTFPGEAVFIAAYMITFASKALLGLFSDLFILSHILTLLFPVQGFIESLQVTKYSDRFATCTKGSQWNRWRVPTDAAVTLKQFGALKGLSSALSESIGWSLLFYMVETIHTYGLHFSSSVFNACVMLQIVGSLYYTLTFLIYTGAAEISRKMGYFKEWLYENSKVLTLSCVEMQLLLDSVSRNSVSITAHDVFSITYPFTAAVLGVLVTFFIVSLQPSN